MSAVITNHKASPIYIPIAGQWGAQNGEVNGWGLIGIYDNTNTQDFGNYATFATLNPQQLGGISFDFPARFRKFYAIHRNNIDATDPWGWIIYRQLKTPASTTRVTTLLYDESAALRNYGNTEYQESDVSMADLTDPVLPAGSILSLALGTPTQAANRNIQLYTGYMIFERLA